MYVSKRIAATGNLPCAPGPAELGIVKVYTGAASAVLTIYDSLAGSGEVIATIDASSEGCYAYMRRCTRGLYAVLSGGDADCTVSFL
jgi:hypothetical protein